jgi:hypothetical protein
MESEQLFGACALMMVQEDKARINPSLKTLAAKAKAEIDVFVVHNKTLIEAAYRFEIAPTHQHKRAEGPIHLPRHVQRHVEENS